MRFGGAYVLHPPMPVLTTPRRASAVSSSRRASAAVAATPQTNVWTHHHPSQPINKYPLLSGNETWQWIPPLGIIIIEKLDEHGWTWFLKPQYILQNRMSNAMFDCWMAKKKRYHAPAAITAPIATAKLSPITTITTSKRCLMII